MYSYIKGIVKEQESNYIVLDNQGIGYQIFVANPFSFPFSSNVFFRSSNVLISFAILINSPFLTF